MLHKVKGYRFKGSLMFIYDQETAPLEIGALLMARTVQATPLETAEQPSICPFSITFRPIWKG